MRRDSPAGSDRGARVWLFASILGIARIAIAVVVLACFAAEGFSASTATSPIPGGLTVHRSTRAAPHRLIVHPSSAVIAPNQTQRFGVTDAQGNPVAVHWNVSGIGCSGQACGTIDEQGVYQPPPSLPQPGIVTVEGVLASNPNYSVLTEVRLQNPAAAAAVQIPARKPQELAAPVLERQNVSSRVELPPLPNAVTAAPAVERKIARSGNPPPLPNVITAAPGIGTQLASRSGQLPALPNAVDAAPVIENRKVARGGNLPPLPGVVVPAASVERLNVSNRSAMPLPNGIAAAPEIERRNMAGTGGLPPLPGVVAATPAVERTNLSSRGVMPLPNVVGAAPAVERKNVSRKANLPMPNVVSAAPVIELQDISRNVALPALPHAVAAAPAVEKPSVARNVEVPSPPGAGGAPREMGGSNAIRSTQVSPPPVLMASASPPPAAFYAGKSQSLLSVIEKQDAAVKPALSPMPDTTAAVSSGGVASTQHSSVTYSNGKLTIDAENLTLAAVLEMVAEKTGAVIEVPLGTGLEHIFEHAGPGQADEVLAQLLNGSAYDFIIVGSPQRPHDPAQILLSLHRADATPVSPPQVAQTTAPPLWTPPEPPAPAVAAAVDNVPLTERLTPEVIGQMMKEKARQLRQSLAPPE
jgi:hypothetical protein